MFCDLSAFPIATTNPHSFPLVAAFLYEAAPADFLGILDLILVRFLSPVHKWQHIRNIPRGEMYLFTAKTRR